MRKISFAVLALVLLALPINPLLADSKSKEAKEAPQYDTLPSPAVLFEPEDGRVEVLAFFWYGCGSCLYIDDAVQKWATDLPKEDVRFTLLPAAFNFPVDFHARIFLTLRAMGLGHEADKAVFNRFQKERKTVTQREQLPELIKELKLNEQEFMKAFDSPAVGGQLSKLVKFMDTYDLPGVPAMVIDGKYRFDIGQTHGPTGYFDLADELVKERREARKKGGR